MVDNLESILGSLVSRNSIHPNEGKLGLWLEKHLMVRGWQVSRQKTGKNRYNLLAERGKGNKPVLFYGHIDTVPTDRASWKADPFKLRKIKDKYYGLGTYDMKGGIAAVLSAASKTTRPVKAFFAVDEENISKGAWLAVSRKRKFFDGVELIISAEPNFGAGLNSITTARTGRCVFDVVFKGKAVHVAEYKKGRDAINDMAGFVSLLYRKRSQIANSKDTVIQVRKVEAESVGMSVCGLSTVEIEVLLGQGDAIEAIQRKIQKLTEFKVSLKTRETPYLEAYAFKNFPYQDEIGKVVRKYTGEKMKLVARSSVGDDNVLATLGIPVITWGPDGGNAHSSNEYVKMKSLKTLAKMYCEVLEVV